MHIRMIATCLIIAGSHLVCSLGQAEEQVPHVIAFGDSTTAPRGSLKVYSSIIQEHFQKSGQPIQVTNAGVPGNHTSAARKRFQKDVIDRNPDVVVIQFGINDSAVDVWKTPPATVPRVSLERYQQNLKFFINDLKKRKVAVILMTPNPLAWTPKLKELYGKPPYDPQKEDGFNVLLKEYASINREIAKQEEVHLVDIWSEFQKHDINKLLLDGMHPNKNGQHLVATQILRTLPGLLLKDTVDSVP